MLQQVMLKIMLFIILAMSWTMFGIAIFFITPFYMGLIGAISSMFIGYIAYEEISPLIKHKKCEGCDHVR